MQIYTYRSGRKALIKRVFTAALSLMVVLQMTPATVLAAVNTSVSITSPTSGGACQTSTTVNVIGTATAVAPQGQLSQYHIQLDWGDGSATADQTEVSTFSVGATPDHGTQTRSFGGSHTYSTAGTYTIKARIYHQTVPGQDNQADAVSSVEVCIIVPPSTGTLTVTKVVSGGTKVVADFPLFLNGMSITSGTATTTIAGSYTVTETTDPNYTGVFSGDCNSSGQVTVPAGGSANCTLTNTYNVVTPTTGTLTVTKVVSGGTKVVADFPLFVNGMSVTSGVSTTTSAGSYTVTETTDSNYVGVFSGDCDSNGQVTVTAGGSASCTLTNTFTVTPPTTGGLVIQKVVINDNGGTGTTTDFSFQVNGGTLTAFEVDGTNDISGLAAGSYTITESHTGYTTSFSGNCSSTGIVGVTAGATSTCVITNDDIAQDTNPDPVLGCMDPDANNYNPDVTQDDESCTYDDTTTTSGGGSHRSGSRGIVQGISTPEGQVLGATFEPGLPNTGNGPINSSNSTLLVLFAGLVALVGLNLASFKALKLEIKSK